MSETSCLVFIGIYIQYCEPRRDSIIIRFRSVFSSHALLSGLYGERARVGFSTVLTRIYMVYMVWLLFVIFSFFFIFRRFVLAIRKHYRVLCFYL